MTDFCSRTLLRGITLCIDARTSRWFICKINVLAFDVSEISHWAFNSCQILTERRNVKLTALKYFVYLLLISSYMNSEQFRDKKISEYIFSVCFSRSQRIICGFIKRRNLWNILYAAKNNAHIFQQIASYNFEFIYPNTICALSKAYVLCGTLGRFSASQSYLYKESYNNGDLYLEHLVSSPDPLLRK